MGNAYGGGNGAWKAGELDTCVIGAGPAGLAVARALRERNLPSTHLERHEAVGGVRDIENPGSPMYDSAHFISGRTLSGFGGFPMPDSYADDPPHKDILANLRSFAEAYGLTERVEFGVEVRHTVGYRSAEELKGKRVLVVGAGNSGCDIASDAARSADHAVLSMRRGYWCIPQHAFGRPVDTLAAPCFAVPGERLRPAGPGGSGER